MSARAPRLAVQLAFAHRGPLLMIEEIAGLSPGTSQRSGSRRLRALLLVSALLIGPANAAWPPPTPEAAVLTIRNTTDSARVDELARGGVPLPRALDVRDTSDLVVVDEAGAPVSATFTVLARWNAARNDSTAPIQWLLVRLRSSIAPRSQRNYRLRVDGTIVNPVPATTLQLTTQGSQLTVDTGAARFVLGGSGTRLFDRIELAGGVIVSDDSRFSSTIDGTQSQGFTTLRRVVVEHVDALSAVVIVEGETGHAVDGGGRVSGGRRFEFAAGSAGVTVREWIDWEGERCSYSDLRCAAQLNARALQQWRVAIAPAFAAPRRIGLQPSLAQPMMLVAAPAGGTAALRQRRRGNRHAAQRFELDLPGLPQASGTRIDAGVALLSGAGGAIGVALRGMADYEPQALRLLADGSLAIDLADDAAWLAARQGTFAEYRVAAFGAGTSGDSASAELWPALNAPLLILAAPQWIAASRATDEFPVGALPPSLAAYDTVLLDLMARTIELRRDRGLQGLMTFGLFPRIWGDPVRTDELDCGELGDPTPADDWDDPYWCGVWTDYHNTSASAFVAAWRFGDPSPLHSLSHPAAMRQLHSQMIRCAPDDDYFYCGQLPAGYGGYRIDNNSSHQYVENLILSYWMSGDRTILERLQDGAASFRGYLCGTRGSQPPGPVCAPGAPITDRFAGVNDRVASQFYQIFRFVGSASDDASFLEDWRSNTARFMTQNVALLQSDGQELGYTERSGGGSLDYITGAGTYDSTQLWMASIYDFNLLYRWEVDRDDAALGVPAIAPSRARRAWARTLLDAPLIPPGDGSAGGVWPNSVRYTFSGARVGGTLTDILPGWAPNPAPNCGNDDCLYDEGKSTLTAVLARSADDLGDPAMRAMALDLVRSTLDSIAARRLPMGKSQGEYFGRLTSAVARLSLASADPDRLFVDGFEN
jgi:hypothetical protein